MNKKPIYSYSRLTKDLKAKAVQHFVSELLVGILEHGIRFNDELNQDDLQARIDKAIAKAEKMQTPWFAHEYILETCREELEGMASCNAEDAKYFVSADGRRLFVCETRLVEVKHG